MSVKPSGKNLIHDNEFYKKLFKNFDKGCNTVLESFRKKINVAVDNCERRLRKCERTVHEVIRNTRKACNADIEQAEVLVNKELRSKIIIGQWTNKFLATSEQTTLDPITFSISRFALNICLCHCDVEPEYLISANIHKHLLDYISMQNNYIVVGPALMALVHISLSAQMRSAIVSAEGLPIILRIIVNSKSQPLLALSAKLLASLAIDVNNKAILSRAGLFHALGDLILGNHCDVDNEVQIFAVSAILNILHRNDANRRLAIELHIVKPILTILQTVSTERLLIVCVRVLSNIAFGNAYTAHSALITGAGECLSVMLEAIDCIRQPTLCHAILAALSNMCGNNDMNQTAIGNMGPVCDSAIRILTHSKLTYVAAEAANFLLAMCWKNNINKPRIAHKGGCTALLRRISEYCMKLHQIYPLSVASTTQQHAQQILLLPQEMQRQSPPYYKIGTQFYPSTELRDIVLCIERFCHALSSILLYEANFEKMIVISGLEELVRLCKIMHDPNVLIALSKVIIPLIPTPAQLLLLHQDSAKHLAEKCQAINVLKKVKLQGFSELAEAPDWLEAAISVLSMQDNELKISKPQMKPEFIDEKYYSKEFSQEIFADTTAYDVKDLRGYIFSIY